MSHPIVHFELWSPNPEAASKFYSNLFGWKINYTPQLSYWLIDTGASMGAAGSSGGINGGMFKPQEGPLPAMITLYVGVDDLGAYVEKAKAAGAQVLMPETEIPGVGWSAVVLDPDGRAIGLFKPLAPPPAAAKPAAAARRRPAKKARAAAAARKAPARKPRRMSAKKKRPAKKK
jgi:uncharacterized protein